MLESVGNDTCGVLCRCFHFDVIPVIGYGPDTHKKFIGDFLVGIPFKDQPDNFELAR